MLQEKSPHPKEWSERTESRHKRYPFDISFFYEY